MGDNSHDPRSYGGPGPPVRMPDKGRGAALGDAAGIALALGVFIVLGIAGLGFR